MHASQKEENRQFHPKNIEDEFEDEEIQEKNLQFNNDNYEEFLDTYSRLN